MRPPLHAHAFGVSERERLIRYNYYNIVRQLTVARYDHVPNHSLERRSRRHIGRIRLCLLT